jgi:uncharacterized protein (TIRG00374 family)
VLAAAHHWPLLIAAGLLFYLQIGLATWRWNLLLAAQGIIFPYRTAFSLSMIGALFNIVIPGSVGGDLMKAYHVSRRAEGKRGEAVVTIGVDRILGLLGLLLLAAGVALLNIRLVEKGGLTTLWMITAVVSLGALAAIGLVMTPHKWTRSLVGKYPAKWPLSGLVNRTLGMLVTYQQHSGVFAAAIAVSMLCQGLACVAFYLCALTLGDPGLPMRLFFFLVPMGLVTTAIPVSPAGLGVGQAAFFSLFRLVGHPNPVFGANACLVYQSVMLVVYLSGLYFYVMQRSLEDRTRAEVTA